MCIAIYCVIVWSPDEGLLDPDEMVHRAISDFLVRGPVSVSLGFLSFKALYNLICSQATHLRAKSSLSFRLLQKLEKALGILQSTHHQQMKEQSKRKHGAHVPRVGPTPKN